MAAFIRPRIARLQRRLRKRGDLHLGTWRARGSLTIETTPFQWINQGKTGYICSLEPLNLEPPVTSKYFNLTSGLSTHSASTGYDGLPFFPSLWKQTLSSLVQWFSHLFVGILRMNATLFHRNDFFCLKRWVTAFNKYWSTACLKNTHSNLLKEEALSSNRKASMPAMLHSLQIMHLFALAMNFCKRRRGCGVTSFKGLLSWDSCILKMRFLFSCMGSQNANVSPFAKEYLTCCAMCIEGTRSNKTFLKICHTLSQRSWYLKQKFHALCAWSAARARWKTQFRFVGTVPFWRNIAGCKISENVTKDQKHPKAVFKLCHFVSSALLSNCLTLPTALLSALCVALLLSFSDTFYSWIPQTHNSSETVANQYTKMSIKYVCRYESYNNMIWYVYNI